MATFEEANRLRLEGTKELNQYGVVKDLTVARMDTSYVLLATFKGDYKKNPPEDLFIGPVRVVSVKGAEEAKEVKEVQSEGPKHPDKDEPDNVNAPTPVPAEDKDKLAKSDEPKVEPKVEPKK